MDVLSFTIGMFVETKQLCIVPGPEPKDDDITLLSLVNSQKGGFATAPEIAPNTSVGEKQTRNRLSALAEDGLLNKRRVGNVNVYWLSDEGESVLADWLL